MHVLLIHPHADGMAGAEKLLGYYLHAAVGGPVQFTLALAEGTPWQAHLPSECSQLLIANNHHFSIAGMIGQCQVLRRRHRERPFDLVHAWAARDWELGALVGRLLRRPVIGTLHDHPTARFISRKRRVLMRWAARIGLDRVVCISQAVREACVAARFPPSRLVVIRNGIPIVDPPVRPPAPPTFRMGYLGVFAERKGLRDLFAMIAKLADELPVGWTLSLAGEAQNQEGRDLCQSLHAQYGTAEWWPRVAWRGWVEDPVAFVADCDLLVCPSSEFEPFGLVLCEAALAGLPALAARNGGIAEIVQDGVTGWLYEPGQVVPAAQILARLARSPELIRKAGEAARQRVRAEFNASRMAREYAELYGQLSRAV